MAVVVTGAAGFIGRILVEQLVAGGEQVIGIDRVPVDTGRVPEPNLTVLTAELTDRDSLVDAALGEARAVFHLAGCPGVRGTGRDVAARRRRDNVQATARVLAAVPLHVPVVVTSSSSVYGGCGGGRPSAESDPLRPRGGYARSKVRAEALSADRLRAGGTVCVARPFTAVGEGQRPDMAIAGWLRAAELGRPLRILGSPERTRDLTDVRELCRALVRLADVGARGPVNVGTGRPHMLRDMVAAVGEVTGVAVRTVLQPAGRCEVAATCADVRRLRQLVGFVPRTDLLAVVRRQHAVPAPVP